MRNHAERRTELSRFLFWLSWGYSWEDARDDPEAAIKAYEKAREEPTERYERLAELFHYETGRTAPGKDAPPELDGGNDPNTRQAAWDTWITLRFPAPREGGA